MNRSPWIEELNKNRRVQTLEKNEQTDIVVVGAGIAGISTAYFVLKNTDKKLMMLEKDLLAHGATGYNAGLLVAEFERSLFDIGQEFGTKLTVNAQKEIETGWNLLDEILTDTKIEIPYFKFKGFGGQRTEKEIIEEVQNIYFRKENGLEIDNLFISDDIDTSFLPEEYKKYITKVPKKELLDILKTKDDEYIASTKYSWAVMNSALFCEKLCEYMQKNYPDRFTLFEKNNVHGITLSSEQVDIEVNKHIVTAEKLILCTNGFENFTIINKGSEKIDFHPKIQGVIGYMTGYTEKKEVEAFGNFYTLSKDIVGENNHDDGAEYIEPYLYISERPKHGKMLVCVGGPESTLNESVRYDPNMEYPKDKMNTLKTMIKNIKNIEISENEDNVYFWHGLMGYTKEGIRTVGEEKKNNRLLYNIGCNGIGILPSIMGGKRISKIINGENFPPSLFDPK